MISRIVIFHLIISRFVVFPLIFLDIHLKPFIISVDFPKPQKLSLYEGGLGECALDARISMNDRKHPQVVGEFE